MRRVLICRGTEYGRFGSARGEQPVDVGENLRVARRLRSVAKSFDGLPVRLVCAERQRREANALLRELVTFSAAPRPGQATRGEHSSGDVERVGRAHVRVHRERRVRFCLVELHPLGCRAVCHCGLQSAQLLRERAATRDGIDECNRALGFCHCRRAPSRGPIRCPRCPARADTPADSPSAPCPVAALRRRTRESTVCANQPHGSFLFAARSASAAAFVSRRRLTRERLATRQAASSREAGKRFSNLSASATPAM